MGPGNSGDFDFPLFNMFSIQYIQYMASIEGNIL